MSETTDVRKVSDEDEDIFARIEETVTNGSPAVVTTRYRGQDVAVLAGVTMDGTDYIMEPLAILITADMLVDLEPPHAHD